MQWCQGPCTPGLVARGKAKQSSRLGTKLSLLAVGSTQPFPWRNLPWHWAGLSLPVSGSGGSSQSPEPSQEGSIPEAGRAMGLRDALCEPQPPSNPCSVSPSLLPGDKGQEEATESQSVPQCGSSFSHLCPKFSTDTVESPAPVWSCCWDQHWPSQLAMDVTSFPLGHLKPKLGPSLDLALRCV